MRFRFACLLLCLHLSAFAAQPLLLQPGDWTDAAAIMRRATVAIEEPIVHPAGVAAAPPGRFGETVELLAVAWARTGNDAFAKRAAEWIRAWFVNPATRIGPSLDGSREVGALGDREMLRIVDAIRILEDSGTLSDGEALAVRAWLGDRYTALVRSEAGQEEAAVKDRQGTWDTVQALGLATHLGVETGLKGLCDRTAQLIDTQIAADGSQPLELARADGLSSSISNLEALMSAAVLASKAGVDLWNSVPKHGGGLKNAVEFLRPYNTAPESWPHNQREKLSPGSLDRVLALARRLDSMMATE